MAHRILVFLCLLNSGCGLFKSEKNRRVNADKKSDLVTYDIQLKVKDASLLSKEKAQLLRKINSHQPVSFNQITDLMIIDHMHSYNTLREGTDKISVSPNELQEFIKVLVDAQIGIEDPHRIKVKYEEKMKELAGSYALYNGVATTLGHIAKENLQQCYSGTILNQVVWRHKESFRSQNPVVIYESGHILSGYIKKKGEKWELFGIETTALGRAEVSYGETDQITKVIRVVDAELFALIELYKDFLADPAEVARVVLEITAERYNLRLIEIPVSAGGGGANPTSEKHMNSSPFSFGSSKMTDKSVDRQVIDKIEAMENFSPDIEVDLKPAEVEVPNTTPVVPEEKSTGVCTGKGDWYEGALPDKFVNDQIDKLKRELNFNKRIKARSQTNQTEIIAGTDEIDSSLKNYAESLKSFRGCVDPVNNLIFSKPVKATGEELYIKRLELIDEEVDTKKPKTEDEALEIFRKIDSEIRSEEEMRLKKKCPAFMEPLSYYFHGAALDSIGKDWVRNRSSILRVLYLHESNQSNLLYTNLLGMQGNVIHYGRNQFYDLQRDIADERSIRIGVPIYQAKKSSDLDNAVIVCTAYIGSQE